MIILLQILLLSTEIFGNSKHCKIYKADFEAFEPYFNISYFKLNPINRYLSVINLDGILKANYQNGIVHGQLFKLDSVDYKPFLVNMTMNTCQVLSKAKSNYFTNIILRTIMQYSDLDLSKGCPILATKVSIRNATLDLDKLKQLPWFFGKYKMSLKIYIEDRKKLLPVIFSDVYAEYFESF